MLPLEEPPLAPWLLDTLIWWAAMLNHTECCHFLGHLSWNEHRPADMEENVNTPLSNPELVQRMESTPCLISVGICNWKRYLKDTWIINLVFFPVFAFFIAAQVYFYPCHYHISLSLSLHMYKMIEHAEIKISIL